MDRTILQTELLYSVNAVRTALTELIAVLDADPTRPQDMSRKFGIDKSLAWKISRVLSATDPTSALQHMPGDAAMEILLRALGRAGAPAPILTRARSATTRLQDAVATTVGDRPTLEIVLDGLPERKTDRLALSRKLAFRGNSGIWGVQARVRVNTVMLAPNPDNPEMVDSALIGGWVDFRRMRPDVRWTLFRVRSYRGDETIPGERSLDPSEPPEGLSLLRRFCSPDMPVIESVPIATGGRAFELGPGPVGNSGCFSCFFGSVQEHLGSRYASVPDEQAEFFATVSTPVELLLFDVLVHKSLANALQTKASVYGLLTIAPNARSDNDLLPIEPERHDLAGDPAALSTPLVAGYDDMVQFAFESLGWNLAQFVGARYTLEYPPFPSTVTVQFPLQPRP